MAGPLCVWGGMKTNNKGFTLIELLIVVAIIGLLAAMVIPNLLDAIDRSKQRATVADMRIWGLALGSYFSDKGTFPPAGGTPSDFTTVYPALVPYAISTLKTKDNWNHLYEYYTDVIGSYSVRSDGKDGVHGIGVTPSTWQNYDLDILLNDGIFTNAPS
jgi:type II secretion system protein G